jgi:high-affinity Fe2+/Pb2+ permease
MLVGFLAFLLDGAGAIWLGQVSGRRVLVVVGVMLLVVAAGVVGAYYRWLRLLQEVDEGRRELREDLERMRSDVAHAQTRRRN